MYESDEEVKEKYEEIMTRLMELIEMVKKSDEFYPLCYNK